MAVNTIVCPSCGRHDFLASVEVLTGFASIEVDASTGEWEFAGSTDIDWQGSKTVGWRCSRCGWQVDDPEWLGTG